jgi:hypothetical protein
MCIGSCLMAKTQVALQRELLYFARGVGAGILRLKTELHQKFLFEVTVTKLLVALKHFPT